MTATAARRAAYRRGAALRRPCCGRSSASSLGPLHLLDAARRRGVQRRDSRRCSPPCLPGHLSAHQKATIDAVRLSLAGLHLSQIAIGVLGVLVITSEYGTGMIRATLAAVPQRRLLLTAKAVVFAAAAVVTGIAAASPPTSPSRRSCPPATPCGPRSPTPGAARGHRRRPLPRRARAARPRPRRGPPLQRRRDRRPVRHAVRARPCWPRCCRRRGRTPSAPTCR